MKSIHRVRLFTLDGRNNCVRFECLCGELGVRLLKRVLTYRIELAECTTFSRTESPCWYARSGRVFDAREQATSRHCAAARGPYNLEHLARVLPFVSLHFLATSCCCPCSSPGQSLSRRLRSSLFCKRLPLRESCGEPGDADRRVSRRLIGWRTSGEYGSGRSYKPR